MFGWSSNMQSETDPQQKYELWYNENHMSAPVDDIELELIDIPAQPTREEILGGIQSIYARLLQKEIASNPGRQRRLNLAASRLFDRLILHHTEAECVQVELPKNMDFSKHYSHLSSEQISFVKRNLMSEAGFFMKGKYPSTIKTKSPVTIETGNAPPLMAGYRRLTPAQQAVVDEYVAKLIEAGVVEPCSGPWASPILLVPKKGEV